MTEKRLRCRASVLSPGDWRSHQCRKAATGTAAMWQSGQRVHGMAACTVHQQTQASVFWSDHKWAPKVEEYMR